MIARLVHFLLLATLVAAQHYVTQSPTYKLEIEQDHSTRCTFVGLTGTHSHKDLDHGDLELLKKTGRVYQGEREEQRYNEIYTHYISHNPDLLWDIAGKSCGAPMTWQFPTFISAFSRGMEAARFPDENQVILGERLRDEIQHPLLFNFPTIVAPLIMSGPSENRINFVFFGDGYTKEEEHKFFADSMKLAQDISNNQTFATVNPLLNFFAAFIPSKESGIGVGGKPKDTTFGLYRDGTELRALYYAKPDVARAACLGLGVSCDYPILLGNDPLYGGLGGRFTVTTSSELNGALVLRHELGHSVIEEGEEYDGGYVYDGPNAANLTDPFPWAHWLSNQSSLVPREERSVMPMQAYPWTMLNTTNAWVVAFNSSGAYSRHLVRFSLSGLSRKEHLEIKLDGEKLDWTPKPGIGVDRWHYDIHRNVSLSDGEHTLSFRLLHGALEGTAQLCSAEIIEFGSPDEFNSSESFIGAFPTWSEKNTTTYRPTNEGCLMRVVTTPNFCKVCVEGLWHALLRRINLIDDVKLGWSTNGQKSALRDIGLQLVALGQFREFPVPGEAFIINWKRNGEDLPEFANSSSITVDNVPAMYTAEVQLVTPEVRTDPHAYLRSTVEIEASDSCAASWRYA